jgi:hypothetical protein
MNDKKTNGRICIVFPGNIFTTPYLKRYTDIIEREGKKYDIVYWNCKGIEEESNAVQKIVLEYPINALDSKMKKIIGYLKFYKLAAKAITENKYDKIISLTSIPAVMLIGKLKKYYDKRFIVDIRDYFKEGNKVYYFREAEAIEHSNLSVISSKGFENFLPRHEYIITHNINWIPENILHEFRNDNKKQKENITLSYIGNMRFIDLDKQLLDLFANDKKFHINLFGNGYSTLEQYCKEKKISNVTIADHFQSDKTIELYKKTDIVLNLYGNNSPLVDFALSNKLYYAAQMGKPILVCPNTYMEEISCGYGFGFVFDFNDKNIKDKLFDYYNSINWLCFYDKCDNFIRDVREDDRLFERKVAEFLK